MLVSLLGCVQILAVMAATLDANIVYPSVMIARKKGSWKRARKKNCDLCTIYSFWRSCKFTSANYL